MISLKFWRARQTLGAYRTLFGSEDGRAVLLHLMAANYVTSTTVVPGDPQMTAFHEGRRAAVLEIMHLARLTPKQIEEMTKEQAEDE